MSSKGMNTVDLFCGCGGMSLGFQNAGFNILAAFDNWKPAIDVYKQNFNHCVKQLDLGSAEVIHEIAKLKPNLIIGGPPCQDFSSAGYKSSSNTRAVLTTSYINIVTSVKPQYFVLENVPRIKKNEVFVSAVTVLKEAGYGITEAILDASYCGVPQARKRLFLIGSLGARDGFLEDILEQNKSDKKLTMREYFGEDLGVDFYFRIPTTYERRAIFSIDDPCVTIRGIDRPIPKNYKKHADDPVRIGDNVRGLTVLERSYVQTFPKSFKFEGTKTNLNEMIGNAVPVKLAEYVARAIDEFHTFNKKRERQR